MLTRACIMGVYGAVTVLVIVLWLLDYKGESSIPMVFGVLGFDGGLTTAKRHYGNPDWMHWTRQYYVVAWCVLLILLIGEAMHIVAARSLTRNARAAWACTVESFMRSCGWVALAVACLACIAGDRWVDYFHEATELSFYGRWPVRVTRPARCLTVVLGMVIAALCLTPLLRCRGHVSLTRLRVHLGVMMAAAGVAACLGYVTWLHDAYRYFSPGKTAFVFGVVVGWCALGSCIGLMNVRPDTSTARVDGWAVRVGINYALVIVAAGSVSIAIFGRWYLAFFVLAYGAVGRRGGWEHPYGLGPTILVCGGIVTICIVWAAWQRKWRNVRLGLCHQCDYDLRGTPAPGTCPECGAVIEERAQKPTA